MFRLFRHSPSELATYIAEYTSVEGRSTIKQQEIRNLMAMSQADRLLALYPSANDQAQLAQASLSQKLCLGSINGIMAKNEGLFTLAEALNIPSDNLAKLMCRNGRLALRKMWLTPADIAIMPTAEHLGELLSTAGFNMLERAQQNGTAPRLLQYVMDPQHSARDVYSYIVNINNNVPDAQARNGLVF